MNQDNDNMNEDDSKKDYIKIDIEKIISDFEYYEKLKAAIIKSQYQSNNNDKSNLSNEISKTTSDADNTCECYDLETLLKKTNETLLTIDSFKTQICRLPLNPCQKEYFSTYIVPLLTTMDSLSRVSYNIGTSSLVLSDAKTLCVNKAELQKNLALVYCLNRKCEEIYCTLEKNINALICENKTTK